MVFFVILQLLYKKIYREVHLHWISSLNQTFRFINLHLIIILHRPLAYVDNCALFALAQYKIHFNRSTQRLILWNIYSFQISIFLAFSQNRKHEILHFTSFVFAWHFIRIELSIRYVSNSINDLQFQIEITLRLRNITEMRLFTDNCTENVYNKAQKVSFLIFTEK